MPGQNHIIKQHIVELYLDEEEGAVLLQNQVSETLLEHVFTELERLFDELSDSKEVISIDKLSVDLGFIQEQQLANELPQKMKEVIRAELTTQISKARAMESFGNVEITRAPAGEEEPIVNIYGSQQNKILALEHYLKTGTLRWTDTHENVPTIKELMSDLMMTQPETMRRFLLTQLQNPNVRKRLVHNCPEALLKALLELFNGNFRQWLFLIIKDVTKTSKLLSHFTESDKKIKDEILLKALLYLALRENQTSTTFAPKFRDPASETAADAAKRTADVQAMLAGSKKFSLKSFTKSPSFLAKDKEKFIQFLIPQLRKTTRRATNKNVTEQAWIGRFYEALVLQTQTGSGSPRTKHTVASIKKLIREHSSFSNTFKTIILNDKWMTKLASKYKTRVPHLELTDLLELPEFGTLLSKEKELRKALSKLKTEQRQPGSTDANTDDFSEAVGKRKQDQTEKSTTKQAKGSKEKGAPTEKKTSKKHKDTTLEESDKVASKKIKELKRIQEIAALEKAQEVPEELLTEFYIENAGLVILWGYLRPFFTHLKLFADGDFISDDARQRAALLLHYLVHEETECEEHHLVLNKLFCGIPLADVVATNIELSEDEIAECEKLLKAILRNWEILKSSSTRSLRTTFLQREGVLTKQEDGDWKLQINRTGVDAVLEYLPWSYSMVKLPWNEFVIFVSW